MSRATDQWAALLEGTTPGPWVWIDEPDDADTQYIIDWATGGMCLSLDAIGSGSAYKPSDPVLAAFAPEAVAEVVRLRRELDAMRGWAESLGTGRPSGTQIARRITHILNQNGEQE